MSGEHGDGLLRTPYLRQMYGDEIYGIFATVKKAFDPGGVMNPGQEGRDRRTPGRRHCRVRPALRPRLPDVYRRQPICCTSPAASTRREIEKCHGCAQCKSMVATTMCPTYKATRREHASPRAKANLLRDIITGQLDPARHLRRGRHQERSPTTASSAACAPLECPSNVNIPKLMLEAKSKYRAAHRGASPWTSSWATPRCVSRLGRRLRPRGQPAS